jgi:prepilin-type N-terminal cleavage/methylation domain-containing protein
VNTMRRAGFSFLELVTVLAILSTLSYFAIPTLEIVLVKSRERLLRDRLTEIRRAIDHYRSSRNGTGGGPLPSTLLDLTRPIPIGLLKIGADPGAFLASTSMGNPFSEGGDRFLWDIRDSTGVWHRNQEDPGAALVVYDIQYPLDGVLGWKKGLDDTLLSDW